MRTKTALIILLALLIQSCNLPAGQSASTAAATSAPSETAAVALPTETATPPAPEVTVTSSGPSALEAILIASPGLGSSLTSPVTVEGQSRPTFEQNLVVAIYAEDGSLLTLQPTTIDAPMGEPGNFSADLSFAVAAEQPGRISVYETSAMDGGIIHLSSVEVTLHPGGAAEIVPAEFAFESIAINSPIPTAEISGGTIVVSGLSDFYFEAQLGLLLCGGGGSGAPNELCGTEDNILASGTAFISSTEMGQPGPFSGELTYSISAPTPARIIVFAASARDGGLLHVTSIPILLLP